MALVPAALAGFAEFVASVLRLPAVPAMVFDGFVQFVVGLVNAPLTTIVVTGGSARCCPKCQQANHRCACKGSAFPELLLSQRNRHVLTILQNPRLGWGVGPCMLKHDCGGNVAVLVRIVTGERFYEFSAPLI